jgi:heme/copper-type cytochrome/quinol oxidase subunit 2
VGVAASPSGNGPRMTVGGSIFLVAVGAILRYAVTDTISGVDLATIGLILMIAGIVGLVIGLFMYASARRTAYAPPERERYVDREPLA